MSINCARGHERRCSASRTSGVLIFGSRTFGSVSPWRLVILAGHLLQEQLAPHFPECSRSHKEINRNLYSESHLFDRPWQKASRMTGMAKALLDNVKSSIDKRAVKKLLRREHACVLGLFADVWQKGLWDFCVCSKTSLDLCTYMENEAQEGPRKQPLRFLAFSSVQRAALH